MDIFKKTMLLLMFATPVVQSQDDFRTLADGTQGRFSGGDVSSNAMYVPPGTSDTIICDADILAAAAAAGLIDEAENCLRFSAKAGDSSLSYGLALVPGRSFNSFFEWFKRDSDKGVCEIIAEPWSDWEGEPPPQAVAHTKKPALVLNLIMPALTPALVTSRLSLKPAR